ncbi:hypothetical protein A3J19_04740 [Candidatus Daviesbacteria bacterium RIFCSPLOWO2_02_FULL_41_8]|nr:MAG: hypothetical protein A2871_02475 [Candidatus Daviesbacteria bacterium RIFCSPHIGHO2_01_FULL_41_23]OGE77012.1 MAG: hypothetical protein A3J19_04740 [Candidatus Daviesbacteria bacterium RIFCSPLOWO2_02_FULL_41_8]
MSTLHKKLFFLGLFSVLGFIALQIPFNKILGSSVSFTLFDFFGPMTGAFLGPVFGITSVLGVELVNLFIKHTPLTTGSIIRLFPTLFAVFYFAVIAKKGNGLTNKLILAVPVLCIIAFIAHPIGRQVPYYPLLFWWIPVAAYFKRDNLFLKSLGATFTAHAVGGTAFLYALNLPAEVWRSLPPIVASERLLFASGIAASYIVVKYTLSFLASKKLLPKLEVASS